MFDVTYCSRRQGNVKEAKRLCRAALHSLDGENPLGRSQVAEILATLAGLLGKEVRWSEVHPTAGNRRRFPVQGPSTTRQVDIWAQQHSACVYLVPVVGRNRPKPRCLFGVVCSCSSNTVTASRMHAACYLASKGDTSSRVLIEHQACSVPPSAAFSRRR